MNLPPFLQSPLLRFFGLGVGVLVLALFSAWLFVRYYRRIPTIRTRLRIAFVVVVLVPILILILTSMVSGFRSGYRGAVAQLEAVSSIKEAEITNWVADLKTDLAVLPTQEDMANTRTVFEMPSDDPAHQQAIQALRSRFSYLVSQSPRFEELFLLDLRGHVALSSDSTHEGRAYGGGLIFNSQEAFRLGSEIYVHSPREYRFLGEMAVIVVRAVVDEEGELMGFLAGRASLDHLNEVMQERAGLGETGESYIVGVDYTLLGGARYAEPGDEVYSHGIEEAIENRVHYGSGIYSNYRGRRVIGVYNWQPKLRVAVVTEQGEAEALRPTYITMLIVGVVALSAVLVAFLFSLALTRDIATPLATLTDTAVQIAQGDLNRVVEVERRDEIGILANAFNEMTGRLRELIVGLEDRVAERTRDLERRSVQLEAAAQVAREAAGIRDVDRLLEETVRLISERFGFYHAGIFIVDEAREYAVLKAASSEGGRRMLARGHRLKVGEVGIVGYVAGFGEPRIALDVGEDAVFFDNPDLPLTRSEMAVPLKVHGEVIGVLDVQSTEPAAFTDEDVAVLETLADQVALAIESTHLLEEAQRTTRELEAIYGERLRASWAERAARQVAAFRYTPLGVEPVAGSTAPVPAPGSSPVVEEGEDGYRLIAPIQLRGETLGTLVLRRDPDAEPWSAEEVTLVAETCVQIGLALENARLLEETQRRAARERIIADITARVRSSMDLETILRTAARELGVVLGTDRATIQLTGVSASEEVEEVTE